MECKECETRIVLHAFSDGECELCGVHIDTPHIPCDKVCLNCSDLLEVCKSCGKDIDKLTDRQKAIKWWNNLPIYNMDEPCKRVLSNLHYDREPNNLTGREIEKIWKKTIQ